MGDGKQFPKPESEIRFCWGMSYIELHRSVTSKLKQV